MKYQSLSLVIEADQKKAIRLQPVTVTLSVHQGVSLYSVRWTEGIDFQVRDWLSIGTFVLSLFSAFRCKNLFCLFMLWLYLKLFTCCVGFNISNKVKIPARRIYCLFSRLNCHSFWWLVYTVKPGSHLSYESGIFSFWRMWMNIEHTKILDKH